MNMHTIRNYKNRYCNQCSLKQCSYCKVKGFVSYVGLQETPHGAFNGLMRADAPTDVKYQNGKYIQKHGNVIK